MAYHTQTRLRTDSRVAPFIRTRLYEQVAPSARANQVLVLGFCATVYTGLVGDLEPKKSHVISPWCTSSRFGGST